MENLMLLPHPSSNQRGTELPYDLIREILLRVPIRSLVRLKCVRKFWYNLIISSDFTLEYDDNERNTGFSIFLERSVYHAMSTTIWFRFFNVPIKLTIPFHMECVEMVGCSKGLICLTSSTYQEWSPYICLKGFIIWNPATGQFRQIDRHNPIEYKNSCGFYFDSSADTFKVAHIEFFNNTVVVNIFRSKDNSWSSEKLVAFHRTRNYMRNTICVGTCMYWEPISPHVDGSILCFDMADELFRFIKLPNGIFYLVKLVGYKDTIALINVPQRNSTNCPAYKFDVWVMDACESWSKQMTCRPSVNVGSVEGFWYKDEVDWVVLSNDYSEEFIYDPKTGETIKLFGVQLREQKFVLYSESFAAVY